MDSEAKRDPRRLNWGSGPELAPGWINSDCQQYHQPGVLFHHGDIAFGLPFEDGFFDGAVAHHSLQCLTYDQLEPACRELRRVLAPGGWLRISVPDVLLAWQAYQIGEESWAGFAAISEPWDLDRKFAHYLTWGGSNRSCFTLGSLCDLLRRAGFSYADTAWRALFDCSFPEWLTELDQRTDESLWVMARA